MKAKFKFKFAGVVGHVTDGFCQWAGAFFHVDGIKEGSPLRMAIEKASAK